MREDSFTKYHPAVNFLFFLGVIVFSVTIQHPVYLLVGFLGGASYYLLLHGRKGWKMLRGLIPLFVILTAVNPLFNQQGNRVLFQVFGRPYTYEALLYGGAIASVLVIMLLWFGCYSAVMTSDKFTSLFGRLIPSLSLLLVMVLRMIPGLLRKASQITGARESIGKGVGAQNSKKEKLNSGMQVLSALTSWALESSVVTADSMRSRGYGTGKNSSFQIFRMTGSDWALTAMLAALTGAILITAFRGGMTAIFTPEFYIAPMKGANLAGLAAYCIYLFIPTGLHMKEEIQWHILRSGI